MKLTGMFFTPIMALAVGLLLCPSALGQEDDAAAASGDTTQLQKDMAELKAELRAIRVELQQIRSEIKASAVQPKPRRQPPQPDLTVYKIDTEGAPVRGPKDAKVTVVEYVDFQCPYCAREAPVIKQVMEEYPNDVRWVFKHFPLSFHKKAKPVHAATALAFKHKGDEGFWKMHDLIMENATKIDVPDLRAHAETVGLDLAEFDEVMADPAKIDALLDKDMKGAAEYKVRGTPSVFINGLKLSPRGLDNYKSRIDNILKGPNMPPTVDTGAEK